MFCNARETNSYSSAQKCEMARRRVGLTLAGDKWEMGRGRCHIIRTVREWRALMGFVPFPLFCCTAHEKREMKILKVYENKVEWGCKGKSRSQRIQDKVYEFFST